MIFKKRKFKQELNKISVKLDNVSGVVNVHRFNTRNVGDLAAAPYLYFPRLGNSKLDILGFKETTGLNEWVEELSNAHIVVGGGGFLERKSFQQSMDVIKELAQKGKKVVFWGVGHNNPKFEKNKYTKGEYSSDFSSFELFGTRDDDSYEWIPCASCMSDLFDKEYEVEDEFGVIMHYNSKFNMPEDYPLIYNDSSFEDTIKFIGSKEYIITNSYHALYWSVLMKKKVIAIPNSSKMFGFKFPVPVCDISEYKQHLDKTVVYEEALRICREQNMAFAEKAYEYLGV